MPILSRNFMETTKAPAPAELPPVCVTLCLASVKSGRSQSLMGAGSKRYEFRWSTAHRALVREYRSIATFYAEETDLRKNLRNPFAITTVLGSTHPVAQALESVRGLIAADRQVDSTTRAAALRDIIALAEAEIARIAAPVPESAPAPSQPSTPLDPAVELPTAGWKDGAGVPATDAVPGALPAGGALTKPVPIGGVHTQAELMQADLNGDQGLRAIAKFLGVATTNGGHGSKSRPDLVRDILAAEQKR